MLELLFNMVLGAGLALICWLALERLIARALPRLEGILPSDIVGPGGWLCDTATRCGIFDLMRAPRQR